MSPTEKHLQNVTIKAVATPLSLNEASFLLWGGHLLFQFLLHAGKLHTSCCNNSAKNSQFCNQPHRIEVQLYFHIQISSKIYTNHIVTFADIL